MPPTHVPVSETAYQLLRELTEQTGQAMSRILEDAVEDYRRKVFLQAVNAGYAALRADPEGWATLEEERRSMAGCLMDGLDPKESWDAQGDLLNRQEAQGHG